MKSKLTLTLTAALIGLAALSAKAAYSEGLNCANWSFNTPGCSAYIDRANKAPVNTAALNSKQEPANCASWSFNTPGCSAYIERKSVN